MRHQTRLLDILDRAENGPVMEEMQRDMFFVPQVISDLCGKYEISFAGREGELVLTDDAFADRLFDAGLEMAEKIGVYCTSTSRQIRWNRSEIIAALSAAPDAITMGTGLDRHVERKRGVGDNAPLTIKAGGVGTVVP